MKTNVSRFAAMLLCFAVILSGVLCVSASKYKSSIVSEDFSGSSLFVCPGDVDFNGAIEAEDLSSIIDTLLHASSSDYATLVSLDDTLKYIDVNGDASVNILDLVKTKKNIAGEKWVKDGTMEFDGKCVYSVSLVPMMNTGATYRITYRYKATTPLTVSYNNAGTVQTSNEATASEWTTAQYTVTTPLTKGSAQQFDLKVQGAGEFDSFTVERVNMDNELVAP